MTQTLDIQKIQATMAQAAEMRKMQTIQKAVVSSHCKCYSCPSRVTFTRTDVKTASVFCGCVKKFIMTEIPEEQSVLVSRPDWCPRNPHNEDKKGKDKT